MTSKTDHPEAGEVETEEAEGLVDLHVARRAAQDDVLHSTLAHPLEGLALVGHGRLDVEPGKATLDAVESREEALGLELEVAVLIEPERSDLVGRGIEIAEVAMPIQVEEREGPHELTPAPEVVLACDVVVEQLSHVLPRGECLPGVLVARAHVFFSPAASPCGCHSLPGTFKDGDLMVPPAILSTGDFSCAATVEGRGWGA